MKHFEQINKLVISSENKCKPNTKTYMWLYFSPSSLRMTFEAQSNLNQQKPTFSIII